jgi:CSLREA domain-containing protein
MRSLTRLCCALFIALLPLLSATLFMPTASAANFTVNSLADTPDANTSDGVCADSAGACTLRAAIEQANAGPSGDVIGFGVNGLIVLTSALPAISKSVTVNGPGAARLTVRRSTTAPYRIFTVGSGAAVHISGLTVRNGMAPLPAGGAPSLGGGGIYNAGDLTLTGVTVLNNFTSDSVASVTPVSPPPGGGIHNDGILTMTDCAVRGNGAGHSLLAGSGIAGGVGGGIYNAGTLVMTGCAVSDNRTGIGAGSAPRGGNGGAGGGIYNARRGARQVSATLTDCVVNRNNTEQGGIVPNSAPDDVSGSGGNGGGIYNASTMTLVGSTISNNFTRDGASGRGQSGDGGSGGGIYNDIPAGGGELKMINCIVSNNETGRGGGGDGVGGVGGGVANPSADSVLKMSHCTVAGNLTGLGNTGLGAGAGVYGALQIRNSVIANNQPLLPDLRELTDVAGGPPVSLGYNYLGFFGTLSGHTTSTDRGGAGIANPFVGTSSPFIDPTRVLIPLGAGPLVDAGLARDIDGQPVMTDIRGAVRPFDLTAVAPQQGGDDSDMGAVERQAVEPVPTPTPTAVALDGRDMHIPEGCAQAEITLKRTGPKDGTTVATYYVNDFSVSRGAHQRGDFTRTRGQVTFAPGEDSKTVPVLLSEDAYHEAPEDFVAHILEVDGRELPLNLLFLIIDDNDAADGATNPIDDNALFVCQHYHDFLSRHADPGGQAFWTEQLDACGGDAECLDRKRADVSAAFFLSIELQNTGYFVIRVNKIARGDLPNVPEYFHEFFPETQRVARGVVVGQPGYEAVLEENKRRYVEEFVATRDFFLDTHAGQTAAQYVDSLFANAGVTPSAGERDAAISAFGTGGVTGMAAALSSVAESGLVYNKLYNKAFVLLQYFAYLRRSPDGPPDRNFDGYQFWLDKLDSVTTAGEDARDERIALARVRRAEMVRAFLHSAEYRGRFGGDPSRGNP